MSNRYHSIPLHDGSNVAPSTATGAPWLRVARALRWLPLLLVISMSARYISPSASVPSDSRAVAPKLWRRVPAREACSMLLASSRCARQPAAICAVCTELTSGVHADCELLRAADYCTMPSEAFSAPACARCGAMREADTPAESIAPDVDPEEDEEDAVVEPSPAPPMAGVSEMRWNLILLCQRLHDTEAFCLEESLDEQLCRPCAYCSYLRESHKCQVDAPAVECFECGIVQGSSRM